VTKITPEELSHSRAYEAAEPRQLGNLHERMKYALACAQRCRLNEFDNATWHALWDLAIAQQRQAGYRFSTV